MVCFIYIYIWVDERSDMRSYACLFFSELVTYLLACLLAYLLASFLTGLLASLLAF